MTNVLFYIGASWAQDRILRDRSTALFNTMALAPLPGSLDDVYYGKNGKDGKNETLNVLIENLAEREAVERECYGYHE
jgi:hypothetical protein